MATPRGSMLLPIRLVQIQLLIAPAIVQAEPLDEARIHDALVLVAKRATSTEVAVGGVGLPASRDAETIEWMPATTRCSRRGSRRFCDGPRRVPVPHGEAAQVAESLGLGTQQAGVKLWSGSPERAWVDAAGPASDSDAVWPIEGGRLGRGFGYVRKGALRRIRHDGLDIGARVGTIVRAAADGIVGYADNGLSGYGNIVILVHPDGSSSFYAHMRASYVFAGERVRGGDPIGEVGTTGITFGPHLHFEWHAHGRPRNPLPRFRHRAQRSTALVAALTP